MTLKEFAEMLGGGTIVQTVDVVIICALIAVACYHLGLYIGFWAASKNRPVRSQWDDGRCQNCGGRDRVQSIGCGCMPGSVRVNYENTKYCPHCGAVMYGYKERKKREWRCEDGQRE